MKTNRERSDSIAEDVENMTHSDGYTRSVVADAIERAVDEAVAEAVAAERRNVAAYMLDRADQYVTSSPCWVALSDVCQSVMAGEANEAARHGELDDVYYRVDSIKKRADERRARSKEKP